MSVAGGESRKTFTQFSKRENVKTGPESDTLAFKSKSSRARRSAGGQHRGTAKMPRSPKKSRNGKKTSGQRREEDRAAALLKQVFKQAADQSQQQQVEATALADERLTSLLQVLTQALFSADLCFRLICSFRPICAALSRDERRRHLKGARAFAKGPGGGGGQPEGRGPNDGQEEGTIQDIIREKANQG